jgi:hypothetical protein
VPKNYPDSKKLVTEDYISMTAITVIKGTIKFADIKPQGGDQRRAFEEMCFQLRGEKMRQGLGQGMAGRAASFQRRLGAQQFSVRPLKNLFVGGSPPHPF